MKNIEKNKANSTSSSVRLQKIIAESGLCSRRKAEELIDSGKVKVNGRTAYLGDKATIKDVVTVSGQKISQIKKSDRKYVYYKFYKPRGVACTLSDPHEEKTLQQFIFKIKERVYPVGRLDKNSEGLVILTSDGNFANKIMHPKSGIEKRYRVTFRGKVTEEQMSLLSAGVMINANSDIHSAPKMIKTAPCEINEILYEKANAKIQKSERTVLEFVLYEGKNRQIRKMCDALNLTVIRLKRFSVGGVKLGLLKPGHFQPLTDAEIASLRESKK